MRKFKLGQVSIPDMEGKGWAIESFKIGPIEAHVYNSQTDFHQRVEPGKYKRLIRLSDSYPTHQLVMSNTPMEVRTNKIAYEKAHGRVLIAGLGMGMILDGILSKDEVDHVTVVEISKELIDMVGPYYADNPRVTIIHSSIFDYQPEPGAEFDFMWHDIWDDISGDNIPEMSHLKMKFLK